MRLRCIERGGDPQLPRLNCSCSVRHLISIVGKLDSALEPSSQITPTRARTLHVWSSFALYCLRPSIIRNVAAAAVSLHPSLEALDAGLMMLL